MPVGAIWACFRPVLGLFGGYLPGVLRRAIWGYIGHIPPNGGYIGHMGVSGDVPPDDPGYRGLRPAKASIASRGYLGLFGAVLGLFGGYLPGVLRRAIWGVFGVVGAWRPFGGYEVSRAYPEVRHSMYTRALVYMEWRTSGYALDTSYPPNGRQAPTTPNTPQMALRSTPGRYPPNRPNTAPNSPK